MTISHRSRTRSAPTGVDIFVGADRVRDQLSTPISVFALRKFRLNSRHIFSSTFTLTVLTVKARVEWRIKVFVNI